MESIEMNEAVAQETVDTIKDNLPEWKLDLKSMGIGGLIAIGAYYTGMALCKYAIDPLILKMKTHAADRKAAKKTKTGKPAEPQVVEVNLEEDLKIDDEEEES
jgi:hypothetical protein